MAPAAEELLADLGQLGQRLSAGLRSRAEAGRGRLNAISRHAIFRRPFQRLFELTRRLDELGGRATRAVGRRLYMARQHAAAVAGRLESLSPLAVLGRGYSLTQRAGDGHIVRDSTELSVGQEIRLVSPAAWPPAAWNA